MPATDVDRQHMARALQLAARGRGLVEPNPMVGCVIARGTSVVGEGFHTRYGAAHAEIEALRASGSAASGSAMYVTLEPCCHHGKTPPCTDAVIGAGIRRIFIAHRDPFPQVAGDGIGQLEKAGIEVHLGLLEQEARALNAPYLKLVETGVPWIIAKWAMTLDGKLATRTGSSQWISGPDSRARVHQLRGRVDAILVGSGTAARDDPRLTARPPGVRIATRVVVDSLAGLSPRGKLAQTAGDVPVLVACGPEAPAKNRRRLAEAGCEVLSLEAPDPADRLRQLLEHLGRRRMTNVLVEGGGRLLGSLFDMHAIDEVHVFVAAKLVRGADAPSPIAGTGIARMQQAVSLGRLCTERLGDDIYLHGRLDWPKRKPQRR